MRSIARPDGRTSVADLARFFESVGLHANTVRLSPEELAEIDSPAVLHLTRPIIPSGGGAVGHFLVAVPGRGRSLHIVDATLSPIFVNGLSRDTLLADWDGAAVLVETGRGRAAAIGPLWITLAVGCVAFAAGWWVFPDHRT